MARRTHIIAGSAAAALAGSFTRPSRADARALHVAYFPGVSALPLLIAIRSAAYVDPTICAELR